MEIKINFIAIGVAVIANFVLGYLWYTPIFGKVWGKEMGYDPNMKPSQKEFMKGLVYMLIGNFLCAWVLAHNIAAWQFVPDVSEMGKFSNAMSSAIFTWIGFYVPVHLGSTVWEQKSWKLVGINAGYHLVSLLLISFILTYWV